MQWAAVTWGICCLISATDGEVLYGGQGSTSKARASVGMCHPCLGDRHNYSMKKEQMSLGKQSRTVGCVSVHIYLKNTLLIDLLVSSPHYFGSPLHIGIKELSFGIIFFQLTINPSDSPYEEMINSFLSGRLSFHLLF